MSLKQRSSDFVAAGCINQVQYLMLQTLVAKECGLEVGQFTWQYDNIQIYDRHIPVAIELLNREPINCEPKIMIAEGKKSIYEMGIDDVWIDGYPRELVRTKNPKIELPIAA